MVVQKSNNKITTFIRTGLLLFFITLFYSVPFSANATLCDGDHNNQALLGSLALKDKYKGINFGYLCKYSSSTLVAYPQLPYYHAGVDYSATGETDVFAVVEGTVSSCSTPDCIMLIPGEDINGEPIRIFYLHIVSSKEGHVSVGEKIADVKSMSGAHLHIEARKNYTSNYAVGKVSCTAGNGICDTKDEVAALTIDPGFLAAGAAPVSVNYFYRRDDPIIASNQSGENNFDAQFGLKNNDSSPIIIDNMAIDILKDGERQFACWVKDSSTTIQPGGSYASGIQYCEIWDSGSYSAEVRLQIDGNWATHGTSQYFTVDDQPSGITVYDFWRKADPIYASNQSGQNNFDAQFRVQNNESSSVTINNMAIAVLKDGALLFDCWLKDSPTTISGNSSYSTDIKYCEIWNSGSYSVEARLQVGEDWGTYGSHTFTVHDQQTSFPDLVVESPSVDDNTLTPGEDFKVFATVRNAGNSSSAATTLRYYLSNNSTISTSDSEIGTDTVDALSAGANSPEDKSGREAPSSPGSYWVGACVDAVSGESNTGNNCSAGVQITVTDDSPVSQEPEGSFESANCSAFSGWAKDPDTTAPIDVHFYADGPSGTGTYIGSTLANIYRDDLSYSDKNHGFSFALPDSLNDGGEHQIYVYAIDSNGGENPLLAHSPRIIRCGLTAVQLMAVISVIENVILTDDEEENKGWLPAILKMLLLNN